MICKQDAHSSRSLNFLWFSSSLEYTRSRTKMRFMQSAYNIQFFLVQEYISYRSTEEQSDTAI